MRTTLPLFAVLALAVACTGGVSGDGHEDAGLTPADSQAPGAEQQPSLHDTGPLHDSSAAHKALFDKLVSFAKGELQKDKVLVPSRGFGAVVVMNAAHGSPWKVTDQALKLFTGISSFDGTWTTATPAQLKSLAGSYNDPFELGSVTVSVSGTALSATFHKWGLTSKLTQQGQWMFYCPVSGQMSQALQGVQSLRPVFHRDAAGAGEYLVTRLGVARRTK